MLDTSTDPARARLGRVLVVGGYGEVGQVVSRTLGPLYPGRVLIAGRNRARAEAMAQSVGYGARGRAFDVTDGDTRLDGVSLVVMCTDQPDTRFVKQCLAAGVDYVDITAKQSSIDAVERLDGVARRSGSAVVLSVGLAPGVTNLLAAHAARELDEVTSLDLFLMLGPGDVHGEGGVAWTLENLGTSFDVVEGGRRRRVESFVDHQDVLFPGQHRPRRAYRFNFPDQRTVARTLSIPTVSTWLCFDSAILSGAIRVLARWARRARSLPSLARGMVLRAMRLLRFGSDACVVLARAKGRAGDEAVVREFSVAGRRESKLTGLVAAETARLLLSEPHPPGVLHIEQLAREPGPLLERLRQAEPETRLVL